MSNLSQVHSLLYHVCLACECTLSWTLSSPIWVEPGREGRDQGLDWVKPGREGSDHSLLHSRSGRSHVTLPVPTRLLQTDIHSFLGVLHFCLLGPMSLSFSCHCIHCTNHRRKHSQENESHTLIGLFPRKECMLV